MGGGNNYHDNSGSLIVIDDSEEDVEAEEEVELQPSTKSRKRLRPNNGSELQQRTKHSGLDVAALRRSSSSSTKPLSKYRPTKRSKRLTPESSPMPYNGPFFDDSDSDGSEYFSSENTREAHNVQQEKTLEKGKEKEFEYEPYFNDEPTSMDSTLPPLRLSPAPISDSNSPVKATIKEDDLMPGAKTPRAKLEGNTNWKEGLYRYVRSVFNKAYGLLERPELLSQRSILLPHLMKINQHEYYHNCSSEIERDLQVSVLP